MWEALAALLAIAGILLRQYLADRAEQETHTDEADTQAFDQALARRDADALSAAFERLRDPDPAAGDGDPGGPDDPAP